MLCDVCGVILFTVYFLVFGVCCWSHVGVCCVVYVARCKICVVHGLMHVFDVWCVGICVVCYVLFV